MKLVTSMLLLILGLNLLSWWVYLYVIGLGCRGAPKRVLLQCLFSYSPCFILKMHAQIIPWYFSSSTPFKLSYVDPDTMQLHVGCNSTLLSLIKPNTFYNTIQYMAVVRLISHSSHAVHFVSNFVEWQCLKSSIHGETFLLIVSSWPSL